MEKRLAKNMKLWPDQFRLAFMEMAETKVMVPKKPSKTAELLRSEAQTLVFKGMDVRRDA